MKIHHILLLGLLVAISSVMGTATEQNQYAYSHDASQRNVDALTSFVRAESLEHQREDFNRQINEVSRPRVRLDAIEPQHGRVLAPLARAHTTAPYLVREINDAPLALDEVEPSYPLVNAAPLTYETVEPTSTTVTAAPLAYETVEPTSTLITAAPIAYSGLRPHHRRVYARRHVFAVPLGYAVRHRNRHYRRAYPYSHVAARPFYRHVARPYYASRVRPYRVHFARRPALY